LQLFDGDAKLAEASFSKQFIVPANKSRVVGAASDDSTGLFWQQ
jgi:hypothetical protein